MSITMNIKKLAIASFLVTALCFQAQADDPKFSGSLGFDYNSHFISSGKDVWSTGGNPDALFNPSAGFDFNFGNGFGLYTGIWADVNSETASSIGGDIQEVDIWVGGYYTYEKWTGNIALQQWYYGGETEGIIDFTVSYEHWLSPYIKFRNRVEQNGASGGVGGAAGGQQLGTIVIVGGSYGFSGEFAMPESLSFTIPFALGFSVHDGYYGKEAAVGTAAPKDRDSGVSFLTTGLHASLPLDFVPEGFGGWDFHGGINIYHTPKSVTGNPKATFLTFTTGLGMAF